ncbi:hypothetical protein Z043_101014 [Scleropages formosus]|uniref:Uncharacterized protein n=1 Tax=Scleropages formosus TaxID=113540 RepID=A0A0P7XR88_SCLFO|nr:hypothetical protein Z043_101014 [Scleropages formosus]
MMRTTLTPKMKMITTLILQRSLLQMRNREQNERRGARPTEEEQRFGHTAQMCMRYRTQRILSKKPLPSPKPQDEDEYEVCDADEKRAQIRP